MPEGRVHAFLDESGERDYGPKTQRYFVVAGVLATEDKASILEDELRGVKRAFFGTPDVELKSSWIRNPERQQQKYLEPFGLSDEKLSRAIDAIYDWFVATDLVLISGVIDKEQMQEEYKFPHNPSSLGYVVFLQRYQKYLEQHGADGAVTFDDISGKTKAGNEWKTLLTRQHRDLKDSGCPYTKMKFPRVDDHLSFDDSAHIGLIQIADLAAYNIARQFHDHGAEWDDPASKKLKVYPYFLKIVPRLHHDGTGVFAGYGIGKMPSPLKRHRWMFQSE